MLCWRCRTPIPESYADDPPRTVSGEPIHRDSDCVDWPAQGIESDTADAQGVSGRQSVDVP
jgi:hypothetical protein